MSYHWIPPFMSLVTFLISTFVILRSQRTRKKKKVTPPYEQWRLVVFHGALLRHPTDKDWERIRDLEVEFFGETQHHSDKPYGPPRWWYAGHKDIGPGKILCESCGEVVKADKLPDGKCAYCRQWPAQDEREATAAELAEVQAAQLASTLKATRADLRKAQIAAEESFKQVQLEQTERIKSAFAIPALPLGTPHSRICDCDSCLDSKAAAQEARNREGGVVA